MNESFTFITVAPKSMFVPARFKLPDRRSLSIPGNQTRVSVLPMRDRGLSRQIERHTLAAHEVRHRRGSDRFHFCLDIFPAGSERRPRDTVLGERTRRGFRRVCRTPEQLSKAKVLLVNDECGGLRAELPNPHLPGHRGNGVARSGYTGFRVRLYRLHPSQPDANARPDPEPAGQSG